MRFQAVNRCLMASVWWGSDFRLSTLARSGLILVRCRLPKQTKTQHLFIPHPPVPGVRDLPLAFDPFRPGGIRRRFRPSRPSVV